VQGEVRRHPHALGRDVDDPLEHRLTVALAEVIHTPDMRLRDVGPGDLDAYLRMRCDPLMMAELGGPLPRADMPAKVATDVRRTRADEYWVSMILPDDDEPETVAGNVALWSHEDGEQAGLSEIGWMVLPEHQGQGLAKRAVHAVLERARDDGRWGVIHAFPGVTNAASNALCRSLGFTLVGERDVVFAGRTLATNHWQIDPQADLTPRNG
jgi:RimJ/RimL family protein N-acetyltransferase